MSWRAAMSYLFTCDECGAESLHAHNGNGVRQARASLAAREGWTHQFRKDRCPQCPLVRRTE